MPKTVPSWVLQGFGGFPLNLSTPLTIEQAGEPELAFDAHWETRPLQQPIYWALRLRHQNAAGGFELQFMHHKLYLGNLPPEVGHFEVTHGFNILTGHRLWRRGHWTWRAGAGVTLPNPDTTVRGRRADIHDYRIGGPALVGGVGYEHALSRRFLVAAEGQFIAAWARFDVADGTARARSLGFHFLVGLGAGF